MRRDGVLLAALPAQLDFAGNLTRMLAPLDQLANGDRAAANGSAWSGVNGNTCVDWSEPSNSFNGDATSFAQVGAVSQSSCDMTLPIYCLRK